MTDDGIGRLLVASLHQSIADTLPTRLEYYEHWLSPMGLRDGRGGLAPLGAVLSFLRREGEPVYTTVMQTAGRYAAEWHYAEAGSRLMRWVPRRVRSRPALRGARGLLRAAFAPLGVRVSLRRGTGTLVLSQSVFCTLREPWPWPTCAYVAGAVQRWLELHGIEAQIAITACQAQGLPTCTLAVTLGPAAAAAPLSLADEPPVVGRDPA
jgi:hypothetical protein